MFANDFSGPDRPAHSKNWFNQGRELLEESRYEDAIACFEEAKRLGHPKAAEAILLCKGYEN
jgi:hypothetical protein